MTEQYYLFKGCLIPTRLPYLEASSKYVLDRLGVDILDLPGATCCVEPIGLRTLASDTWLVTVARMLAVAEKEGRDVLTLCNGCYLSFLEAVHELKVVEKRDAVNGVLSKIGLEYKAGARVRHILEKVHSLGEDKLRSMVSCEQSGLKIAPHTGCHFLRPSGIGLPEDPIAPAMLADIASWSGAEVVNKEFWPECCGGGVSSVDEGLSSRMLERVAGIYRAKGANCILTPCPFCFSQFDLRQKGGLPVLYITELIAMAMAAPAERLGLRYHRVKVMQ
ncbi:MAG: hypothetical protein HPY73_06445 [Methanomassiliicoccales archaeon]|nr:MAG: hypothetical protein HPY73_06445 [Methanomassiliicoccales archaeon]